MTKVDPSEDLLADRSAWTLANCSVANALDVVGNRICLLLVREALLGTTRFDDFAARVGVSEPAAAKRLAELTAVGVLERVPYRQAGQRERMEYRLTEKGRALSTVITALREWGDMWATDHGDPSIHPVHTSCGAPTHLELRCANGHRVAPGRLAVLAGPAAGDRG